MSRYSTALKLRLVIPSTVSIFFLGILFLLCLIFIAPVDYLYFGSPYSWLYVEISLLSVFIGLVIGAGRLRLKPQIVFVSIKEKTLKKVFLLSSSISGVGILLRIIDKFVVRGGSFQANVIENRDVLLEAGVNFFSVTSSFLYPMAMLLPFVYLLLRKAKVHKPVYLAVVVLLSLYSFIDTMLVGSRSVMMIFVFLITLYLYILGYLKIRFNFRNIFLLIALLVLLLTVSGFIFDNRTTLIGVDPTRSPQISVYAYFIPLENKWVDLLVASEGIFYYLALGTINFVQYMVHGFFEMLYLVDNFDTHRVLLGQQNFAVIVKFVSYILRVPFSFSANDAVLVRTGMYNTLFGPIYYDFAFGGVVFSLLLGIIIGRIYLKIVRGDIFLIPLYSYFLVMLFFSLIVNMIIFGQGVYTIASFVIFYILSKLFFRSKRPA